PFAFHWWDHVFNKAAANIAVEAGRDGISVKTLSEQGGRITNKKPRKAGSAGSMLYGRFVKSATLTACGEESTKLPAGSESSEEEEKLDLSSARRLTDEELMRVCGGRTAHKGARHGLTMSAKLARLEEQERAFLATYQHKEQQHEPPESSPQQRGEIRKKKRRQSRDGADAEVLQSQELSREEEVAGEEGKAVKRKKKKNQELSGEEEVAGEEGKAVKRKKKKKKKKNQELSGEEEVAGEEGKAVKRKKKKRKKKNQELSGEEEVAGEEGKAMKRKKKKSQELSREEEVAREKGKAAKRTKKQQGEEDKEELAETEVPLEDTDGPDQAGHSPRKKRKKRKRKPE
ncbi:LOW QUALITY PROTEIN: uncharacterized protein LOC143174067, partial [Aptenodytes patagonicus]|uniref:LOW QUALITY PROTEIN: uncharacterized protein LOC143174067 n=1 Tax=Aptenodytes patagonicus TaxID=9234 RepID=UPI003FA06F89